jgi:DNA invertase Pin-like site-specific DNA recombinase
LTFRWIGCIVTDSLCHAPTVSPLTMKTAISYSRWSTPEQGSGDSLKRQSDMVAAYCAEKNLKLLDSRIDAGVSAFRGSNATKGKLRQLRNELEDGSLKVDYILIEAFDRMSRDTAMDAIQLLSSIVSLGPTVVTLHNRQEYSKKSLRENSMQLMWILVETMRGQDESAQKSRRAKGAWRSKRAIASKTPMTAKGPAWLDAIKERRGAKLVTVGWAVNEEKAKVVVGIYRMAAQGKSLDGITKALNDLGIKPITGAKWWYRQQISRFLQSKAVIGTHEPSTTNYEHDENDDIRSLKVKLDEIPNYYPAIIDDDLAKKVWALNGTRVSFRGTGKASFITSGITKCYLCGHTMTYNSKGKYKYIICSNRRFNACPNKKLTVYGQIEGVLLNELVEVLDGHSPIAEDTNVTDLKRAMEEKEAEIGRVVDAIRYRGFDTSMGGTLDSLERQRDAIRAQLGEASQRASKSIMENSISGLKSSILNGGSVEEINQHMRLVFKSLVIDDKEKVIDLTFVDGSRTFILLDRG